MRCTLVLLAMLLLAAACAPATQPPREAVIPGAALREAPFAASGVDLEALGLAGAAPFRTAYEVLGQGAPVVMVHGIGGGSSRFQYRLNAPAVAAAGYRVYAPDLLGFGASSRPAGRYTQDLHVAQLEAFLEAVVDRPAVLVANGLSAAYAIRLAAAQPERVAGLVLIGPTGYERLARAQGAERIDAFQRLRGPLGGLLYGLLLDEGTQRLFLLDAYAGPESLTSRITTFYERQLRAPNAQWVVFSFVTGNLDQDVSETWPRVAAPALIVWGTEAETTPLADAEDFLRARPETAFLPLRDAKLLPNEDRAEAFDAALLDFLERLGW